MVSVAAVLRRVGVGQRFARQEAAGLHLADRLLERAHDERHVRVRVRRGQEAGPPLPGMDAPGAQMEVHQAAEPDLVVEVRVEQRGEVFQVQRHAAVREEAVQLRDHRAGALVQAALEAAALALEVVEDGPGSRQRQRMADVSAREERHADFRERPVFVLPRAAVERVHVLGLAGERAHGHPAAHHLAPGGQVRLHAEVRLRAARMAAEARDDLVEDERAPALRGDLARGLEELARLEVGPAALDGFDQDGGQFVRVRAQQFQPFGGPVVDHQHVADDVLGDAREPRARCAAGRPPRWRGRAPRR